jgi:uncharacterized membrane protein YdjX (TVP38/TMEM64 family)
MLDDWAGKHAAEMVFLARFLPVISFNLVNYAAGLTKISWWTFGWTTGVGILPVTILMAAMGDQVGKMPWSWWLALFATAAVVWLVVQRWLRVRASSTKRTDSVERGIDAADEYGQSKEADI